MWIVEHHFKGYLFIIVMITIMIWFISPILYLLHSIGFPWLDVFTAQKKKSSTEKEKFGISGASTDRKNNMRVKAILKREICFLFEID